MSDDLIEYFETQQAISKALERLAEADIAGPKQYASHLTPRGCEFCLEDASAATLEHKSLAIVSAAFEAYKKPKQREKNLAVCEKHAVDGEVIVGLSHGNFGGHVDFAFRGPDFAYELWNRRWQAHLEGDGPWTVVNFGITHIGVVGLGAVAMNRTPDPVSLMIDAYEVREIKAFELPKADWSSLYLAISWYTDNPLYSVLGRNCLDITYEAINQLNAMLPRPLQSDSIAPENWFHTLPGAELQAAKYRGNPKQAMQFATKLPPRTEPPLMVPVKPIPHG